MAQRITTWLVKDKSSNGIAQVINQNVSNNNQVAKLLRMVA